MSTVEKLTAVSENVPKVYHAGQMSVICDAESLKGAACGKFLVLDDTSPVTHPMKVRLHGKNLLDKTQLECKEAYHSQTLSQTDTGFTFQRIGTDVFSYVSIQIGLVQGTYHLKADCVQSDGLNGGFTVWDSQRQAYIVNAIAEGSAERSFTAAVSGTYRISFYCNKNSPADTAVTFSGVQLEPGSSATAYAEYNQPSGLSVTRYGGNLAKVERGYSSYGASVNATTVVQDTTGKASFSLLPVIGGITYYIKKSSVQINANSRYFWFAQNPLTHVGTAVSLGGDYALNKAYHTAATAPANARWLFIRWSTDEDSCPTQNPCVTLRTTIPYEPYREPTVYTAGVDGTVDGVESLYPSTVLLIGEPGVYIDCEYYRDIDQAFEELKTQIALSGGE